MKKDRFTQIAEEAKCPNDEPLQDVAKLLRRHHAKIRRMVNGIAHTTPGQFAHVLSEHGYRYACERILCALDAMAGKGKP